MSTLVVVVLCIVVVAIELGVIFWLFPLPEPFSMDDFREDQRQFNDYMTRLVGEKTTETTACSQSDETTGGVA